MNRLMIVMGVSGSGKSVVGNYLSEQLKTSFIDGDDLHPPENVELMESGVPLDDESRKPWLAAICQKAEEFISRNQSLIVACSALKRIYRDQLRAVSAPVYFLFLNGDRSLIHARMVARKNHYMPPELLDSQFNDLENPKGEQRVIEIDISVSVEQMLSAALDAVRTLDERELRLS